jgi:hypothetical protein
LPFVFVVDNLILAIGVSGDPPQSKWLADAGAAAFKAAG